MGFDWIWLLSVWRTGPIGQRISRQSPEWRREFEETLPDLRDEDIAGSGFAITGYTVHASLGGDRALARLRERSAAADRGDERKGAAGRQRSAARGNSGRHDATSNGTPRLADYRRHARP